MICFMRWARKIIASLTPIGSEAFLKVYNYRDTVSYYNKGIC